MSGFDDLAARLHDAQLTRRPIPPLTGALPDLSLAEAYVIQGLYVRRRSSHGERRIGLKLGLTNRAAMLAAGAERCVGGRLTDAMLLEDGGAVSMSRFLQPRVEAALAFRLKEPLAPGVTPAAAMAAVDAVAPVIEVLDSRYTEPGSKLADLVADNAGCAGLIVGPWCPPDIDLSNLGVVLSVNGRPQAISSTAAVLGHPVRALAAAAALCEQWGETLQPGDLVVSAGGTAPRPIGAGEALQVEIQHLGSTWMSVVE